MATPPSPSSKTTPTAAFAARIDVAVAGAVEQLGLGDLDQDGDLDAVALSFTSTGDRIASTLLAGPNATFLPSARTDYLLEPDTRSINLGDVDKDGDLDLVGGSSRTV